jgi:threonine synthase
MQMFCTKCRQYVTVGRMGGCPSCKGILTLEYPDESINRLVDIRPGPGIDRYRPLLPTETPLIYLGEGDTPLLASRHLGPSLGLEKLFFKNEGCNPTGAFKDRGAALVVSLALDACAKGIITASSGNAGAAIAAYSAAAGLNCILLLEPGNPPNKLRQALAVGARAITVDGVFSHGPDAIRDLIIALAENLDYYPAFVWAPVNPYILEAFKTISYEMVARLPGTPDVVVCPVGGGDLFSAQWRGYTELKHGGVINTLPRMIAVQSFNAPPLLEAFRSGVEKVVALPYANSKISGINVPFTGDHALAVIRESGGTAAGVKDSSVFKIQQRLGREEGIWVEPASAAPVAALEGLLSKGIIQKNEKVVCIMSGAGFKDTHLAQEESAAVNDLQPAAFDVESILARIRT